MRLPMGLVSSVFVVAVVVLYGVDGLNAAESSWRQPPGVHAAGGVVNRATDLQNGLQAGAVDRAALADPSVPT